MKHYPCSRHPRNLRRTLGPVVAIIAATGFAGGANAMRLDTGNRDLTVRWDNTFRYNAGWRMESPDSLIANHPLSDESDAKFKRGDMVTNRVDLLSELDVTYQKKYGFRLTGQAWYDHAYSNTSVHQSPIVAASGTPASYENNKLSPFTSRWYRGPSGEILDAFVFGGTEIGGIPVNAKLGQHTLYWGQALFYLGGISYSQAGLDLRKGVANPGSEVKELFMPVNQFSFQAQLTRKVSLAGQYFFDWKYYRAPEGGTFLSSADFVMDGPASLGYGAGILNPKRGDPLLPEHKSGNWGMNLKWQPDFMAGGSLAATYRLMDEKLPWSIKAPDFSSYRIVFPRNTEIFGLSIDTSVGQASVAGEIAYRKNAGLKAPSLMSATLESELPRGDVLHFAVNAVYLLPETSIWTNGSLAAELSGSHLERITKNKANFQGVGSANCTNPVTGGPGNENDGCASRSALGMNVSFTPQWQEAFPSIDLSMPMSVSYGIKGNESDLTPGNEGSVSYGIGLEADVFQRYKVNVAYHGFDGKISHVSNGVYADANGGTPLLRDRGWLSLTLKASF